MIKKTIEIDGIMMYIEYINAYIGCKEIHEMKPTTLLGQYVFHCEGHMVAVKRDSVMKITMEPMPEKKHKVERKMTNIKVIENMKPWEVMKAHEEGAQVAWFNPVTKVWVKWALPITLRSMCDAVANGYEIGIIDESPPELTAEWWDGFDWEFFSPYHGLTVDIGGDSTFLPRNDILLPPGCSCELIESPFYPWQGGECPVPGHVEVEVETEAVIPTITGGVKRVRHIERADDIDWAEDELVSFRLTGRVL